MQDQKLPPQAIELEEAVLGACMISQSAFSEIENIISKDCFYKQSNQHIFKAIESLNDKGEPIDILTVTQQLQKSKKLQEVGGPYHISQLTNKVGYGGNVQYHAMIVYQKFVQREVIRASQEIQQAAFEDFDEMMDKYNHQTLIIDDLYSGKSNVQGIKELAKQHVKVVEERTKQAKKGGLTGIDTGLIDLNTLTGGWQKSDLIVIAARPGMGKTAVALKEAKAAAASGKPVAIFSLEMENISLFDRMVCSDGGINSENLKTGKLTNKEFEKYNSSSQQLQQLPIKIDDTASVDMKHIRATARQLHRKGECELIIIDYLQLVEAQTVKGQNREQEIAKISRQLKVLAKELNIPVILLAQLSRAVETRGGMKKPMLSDLRESGAIEQDADKVMFIWRGAYYGFMEDKEGNSLKGLMHLDLAKHRNGPAKEIVVRHSYDLTQIFDHDEAYEDLPEINSSQSSFDKDNNNDNIPF